MRTLEEGGGGSGKRENWYLFSAYYRLSVLHLLLFWTLQQPSGGYYCHLPDTES